MCSDAYSRWLGVEYAHWLLSQMKTIGRRLVAAPGVEGARDLPLLVEDVPALLDAARRQEVAVDREQILAVEPRILDFFERADRLRFPGYRHTHSQSSSRIELYRPRDIETS